MVHTMALKEGMIDLYSNSNCSTMTVCIEVVHDSTYDGARSPDKFVGGGRTPSAGSNGSFGV